MTPNPKFVLDLSTLRKLEEAQSRRVLGGLENKDNEVEAPTRKNCTKGCS